MSGSFPMLGKFLAIISWNIFPVPFSLFSFWHHYNTDVGAFNIVPEFPETVLIFFNLFSLFGSASVICTNLSSTLLIQSSASCILLLAASSEFLYFSYCILRLFLSLYLVISLVSVSCKLSIFASSLFPMSCIIFSINSLKSFSWRLRIS